MVKHLLPLLLLLPLPALADSPPPPDPAPFLIRNVRLLLPDGTELPDAIVVIRNGRIEAAGPAASVSPPAGLTVVDGAGGVLAPGLVLPATRMTLPPEVGARDRPVPTESVGDALPPFHPLHRIAAAAGVSVLGLLPGPGAPGGEGLAVRPAEAGTDAFRVEGARFLRVDVDPTSGWARNLSAAFDRAKKEVEAEDRHGKEMDEFRAASAEFEARKAAAEEKFKTDTAEFEKAKAAAEKEGKPVPAAPAKGDPGKPPAEPKKPPLDERTRILRDALRRTVSTVVVCGSAGDADRALDALEPWRLRLVFRVSGDAWRAAARIAGAGASIVLEPRLATAPGSADLVNPAAVFAAEGCPVAFALDEEGRQGLSMIRLQAGLLVKAGLPRAAAMRALSAEGARILGIEKETGSVAAGLSADLVLHDGDPLEAGTRIVAAWVRGRPVPLAAAADPAAEGRERP